MPMSAQPVMDTHQIGLLKQAGTLHRSTQRSISMEGRIRYPMQRSRGAQMEEDLEKTIDANARLA
jgi:hypothetical protein